MFLFRRDKSVLPEVHEIILVHFSFCSHFRLTLRKLDVRFRISSHSLFKIVA